MPVNPSSSVIIDNQIDSFVINGVGTGLLNQTDGSIKQVIASPDKNNQELFQNEIEAQTINLNTDQYSRSPNPQINLSVHDNGLMEINDPQLAKTGIINKNNNPKLRNLQQNMDISQNYSVFDMSQQIGANKDLSQSQILANLDQT